MRSCLAALVKSAPRGQRHHVRRRLLDADLRGNVLVGNSAGSWQPSMICTSRRGGLARVGFSGLGGKRSWAHNARLALARRQSWDATSISLSAACDLFMRFVTRTSHLEHEKFDAAKSRLIERGEKFGEISLKARKTIAMLSQDFISDGSTMLVHGYSRVVLEILKLAASNRKLFRVLCTEGRPDRTGLRMSNELAALGIPVKVLIDSAVAYSMDEVDMVFVGADGVVESGGIINMMGTYQIALVAHSMNKPLYVAAESYKFARLYPLDQKDMTPAHRPIDFGVPIPAGVEVETSARDYTPPQYLTLLLTDLGVLTPSVVSDELIQLYL
ncbi:Translation initiation factor eIF-2B subunit alpha [Hordeum vulgare]|nr:Translation initiation factor eIF-2B subunit alpha [Hordeum vulgare]